MKNSKKKAQNPSLETFINTQKLKDFGITKDLSEEEIEKVDGEEINGGKENNSPNTTAVCGHWPTNAT